MLQAGKSGVGGERLSGAQNNPVRSRDSRERSTGPKQPVVPRVESTALQGEAPVLPLTDLPGGLQRLWGTGLITTETTAAQDSLA